MDQPPSPSAPPPAEVDPTAGPLVSAIMPTADRPGFVARALRSFAAQTWPHRELLVLDDGQPSVAELCRGVAGVRYERLPARLSVGRKRQLACELARGELIAHWDDDDWSLPHRLEAQVRALLARPEVAVCGSSRVRYVDPAGRRAWRYVHPGSAPRWLQALVYRRSAWERVPFEDRRVGEDSVFLRAFRGREVLDLAREDLVICTVHPRNTAPKLRGRGRWWPLEAGEAEALLDVPLAALDEASREPEVTVSLPFHRAGRELREAVGSALEQRGARTRVVAVNDGGGAAAWAPLEGLEHPRLVRLELPRRQGPSFAHEVVLRACHTELLLLHDARERSSPDRVRRLARTLREQQVASARCGGPSPAGLRLGTVPRSSRDPLPDGRLQPRLPLVGLHRVEALRSLGGLETGLGPGGAVLFGNLLLLSHGAATWPEALAARPRPRPRRPRGLRGPRRPGTREVPARAALLTQLYAEAMATWSRYCEGQLGHGELLASLADLTRRHRAPELEAALDHHAARLRTRLELAWSLPHGGAWTEAVPRAPGAPPALDEAAARVLCRPLARGRQGALSRPLQRALLETLRARGVRAVRCLGGDSELESLLAAWAGSDPERRWRAEDEGPAGLVLLLPGGDGEEVGAERVLEALDLLGPDGQLWISGGLRESVARAVDAAWRQRPLRAALDTARDPRGCWVLEPGGGAAGPADLAVLAPLEERPPLRGTVPAGTVQVDDLPLDSARGGWWRGRLPRETRHLLLHTPRLAEAAGAGTWLARAALVLDADPTVHAVSLRPPPDDRHPPLRRWSREALDELGGACLMRAVDLVRGVPEGGWTLATAPGSSPARPVLELSAVAS